MAITTTDLVYRLSVKTGAAGDSTSSTPADSLGKYVATTVMDLVATLNNLFDDVAGDEAAAGDVEYRCIFILNNHASLVLQGAKVWLSDEVAGGAAVAIGLDPAGVTAKGSASAQAAEIATESDAPAGVSFSSPTDKASGLSIGDIAAGSVAAIWVRRTVAALTSAQSNDGATLRVEGDTAA